MYNFIFFLFLQLSVISFCRAESCKRPPRVRNAHILQGCGMKGITCGSGSVSVIKCNFTEDVYGLACDNGRWLPEEDTITCKDGPIKKGSNADKEGKQTKESDVSDADESDTLVPSSKSEPPPPENSSEEDNPFPEEEDSSMKQHDSNKHVKMEVKPEENTEENGEAAECCRIKIEITGRDEEGTKYCPCSMDCTVFFACYRIDSQIKYEKQSCPAQMRYIDERSQCAPMFGDKCGDDPCSKSGSDKVGVWSSGKEDECATYYKCENLESKKQCCEPNTRWNPQIKMCLFDTTCKDAGCAPSTTAASLFRTEKGTNVNIDLMTCLDTRYKVMRKKIIGDPKSYLIIMKDDSKHQMPCPPGTTFSVPKCKCSSGTRSLTLKRKEVLLNMSLTADVKDHSTYKFAVLPIGRVSVTIKNGAACFPPEPSSLEVVGLNKLDGVRNELSVSFWVNVHCSRLSDLSMGIISNRREELMTSDSYSLIAHYDKESFGQYVDEKIFISFQTKKKIYYKQLFVDAKCGKWQHIVFTYDGAWLLLYLDGVLQSITAGDGSSVLWSIESLLRIGKDDLYGDFEGCLKRVVIFRKVLGKKAVRAIGNAVRRNLEICDC